MAVEETYQPHKHPASRLSVRIRVLLCNWLICNEKSTVYDSIVYMVVFPAVFFRYFFSFCWKRLVEFWYPESGYPRSFLRAGHQSVCYGLSRSGRGGNGPEWNIRSVWHCGMFCSVSFTKGHGASAWQCTSCWDECCSVQKSANYLTGTTPVARSNVAGIICLVCDL